MKVLKSPISFSFKERLFIETPEENFTPFFLYFFITSIDLAEDNCEIWYLHGYSSSRDKSLSIIIFSAIYGIPCKPSSSRNFSLTNTPSF